METMEIPSFLELLGRQNIINLHFGNHTIKTVKILKWLLKCCGFVISR